MKNLETHTVFLRNQITQLTQSVRNRQHDDFIQNDLKREQTLRLQVIIFFECYFV